MTIAFLIAIPLITAIVLALTPKGDRGFRLLERMSVCAAVLEFAVGAVIIVRVYVDGIVRATDTFAVDALGALVLGCIVTVSLATMVYSVGFFREEIRATVVGFRRMRQYFALIQLFLAAMFMAVATTSPLLSWIAIEASTLATAFLISFYNKPSSVEAAWKYLLINSVGLLIGFLGTIIIVAAASTGAGTHLVTWSEVLAQAAAFNPMVVKIAFIFVIIGYGTKVGLAPMHTWRPDAYAVAPTPLNAFLSTALLNVAFLPILRFKSITDHVVGSDFSSSLFMLFGVLSVVISAFIIFAQKNYKRLLAYSSIEHAGVMALGFGFGGAAAVGALLHMVYHSLVKSMLFLTAGNMVLKYRGTKIEQVRGLMTTMPLTGLCFFIGFFAIAGIPPFGLFYTKFLILSEGMNGYPAVTIITILALALVVVGYLKHAMAMLFGPAVEHVAHGELNRYTTVPIVVLVLAIIGLSLVVPAALMQLIHTAFSQNIL